MTTIDSSSVEDVLDALQIQVANIGDKEISAHCPFHVDHHPSFSINAETGAWICFQCGEAGGLEMLISKVGNGEQARVFLRQLKEKRISTRRIEIAPEEEYHSPGLLYAQFVQYRDPPKGMCDDRFLDMEMVCRYQIKWNSGWVIPIWAPELSYTPADLWGWQFKRMDFVKNFPPGIKRSLTLFGLRELTGTRTILVESPLDVVRIASAGITGALASFGAMVTRAQLQLLLDRSERVVVALDNDLEGRHQAKRVVRYLGRFLPTQRLHYSSGVKDPGEMEEDELIEALRDL